MNRSLKWIVAKTIETAPKLAFQVVASIAATVGGAFITGYYKPEPPPLPAARQAEIPVNGKAAGHLFAATFTEDGFRLRPTYPVEFAAVYGIGSNKPYTALATAEWSTPMAVTQPPSSDHADAPPPKPEKADKKPTLVAIGILPPPRPAALTVVAEAQPAAESSRADEKRVRLLGVPLPGFVPSGETIARTVVSWSDTIVGVIPGL